MTLVLAFATPSYALIAADSGRFDLVQQRWLPPVMKIWQCESILVAKAGEGSSADPVMPLLASQLHQSGLTDTSFQAAILGEMPALHEDSSLERRTVLPRKRCALH